ncbi:MAG: single-stranded-DNA-specific exonuclease RecJ [Cytophagales bacterium]|nr:single-stranded-DNA-specific exonuclease RecJ [Cytophagales bacterium]MCA6366300.1 single-stranded-DNA-specific exonuclease RecJ [Cytophagales bacterium]MCA6371983.1 single-stranded-DNA-specific exonuclease RecJ [Cytophagales bacterium]MCA6376691.1 single-stranded-DNA-specific exonuclease RecJ [Cytophagales bacterium]MCA6383731.1 single-stranded-DNA-specific exonuclease RecJ [Cytophagales bacterium]
MQRKWLRKSEPAQGEIETLSQQINVNPSLTSILLQRGIYNFDLAKKFFRPSLAELHSPFLLTDMTKAVSRLNIAIENGEKILIYGDYDVDGTTAVALVYSYLQSFYPLCDFYIPDRHTEGYGVSEAGIKWAEENGFSLIIALDLGVKAIDAVTLATEKKIDFIICDHHLPGTNIPNAIAVLDPKRSDCHYPFKELSGCGLGFKLMQAYAQSYRKEEELNEYLDLVAVSIASDIVPIVDENRILVHFGLQKLNQRPLPGLKALKEIAATKGDLDVSGVVFTLGPRINAAGRVAHARGAVELLISKTEDEANQLAEKINLKNNLRREFDLSITDEALAMIEANDTLRAAKSTVLFKNTWHKGVIGIVAARCVEKYYRPTVILTESNDKITGSARSVKDFDLYEAISACSDLLNKFGGHKYAAGLTMDKSNLVAFQQRFEEVVSRTITEEMLVPVVEIDVPIQFDSMNDKFNNILKQMAPFGPENQKPVFEAKNVFVEGNLANFKERHLRFAAGQEGNKSIFNVVGFDMIQFYDQLTRGGFFNMAFTLEENTYNGTTTLQIRIKDLIFE